MSKSPVRLVDSSYSSPKRQQPSSLSLIADQRDVLNYNLGNRSLARKQPIVGHTDIGTNAALNKDKQSTVSAALQTVHKNLPVYRRELSAGLSYEESKIVRSIDLDPSPESYTNNGKSPMSDAKHPMSQNNTQAKLNSSPVKHLVSPKGGPPTSPDVADEYMPRGKAAALLGTVDTAPAGKYKMAEPPIITQTQSPMRQAPFIVTHPKSRRNSDPSSNKVSMLDVNRGNDMYQSSTQINIAGHRFHKVNRIGKGERCACCQENDTFINEGHRCTDCKLLVHTKCIQNGGVKSLQCDKSSSKRQLRKNTEKEKATPRNSKYSGTREYTDSTDKIISDAKELQQMQDFIAQKIYKMDESAAVDRAFKQALREFKDNLVAQYSIAHKQKSDTLKITYRDLISNFEHVMETCGNKTDDFPLTMCVNAFRVFMNEFMTSRDMEKPKVKRKKEKKRKVDDHTNFNGKKSVLFSLWGNVCDIRAEMSASIVPAISLNHHLSISLILLVLLFPGHMFQLTIINIPTACEICQLFLLWPIERGLVSNCKSLPLDIYSISNSFHRSIIAIECKTNKLRILNVFFYSFIF